MVLKGVVTQLLSFSTGSMRFRNVNKFLMIRDLANAFDTGLVVVAVILLFVS
jgi:hypothetical protein